MASGNNRSARSLEIAVGLAAIACVAAVTQGCAGKTPVRAQYQKRVQEINEKYDAMLVEPEAPLAGAHSTNCQEFVEKLKSKYTFWKPGEAGDKLCASRPKGVQLRDFELRVRDANNKAVNTTRTKRLAHLKQLYQDALKVEGDAPADGAKGEKKQKLRDKEAAAQAAAAENAEPADGSEFQFLGNGEVPESAKPATVRARPAARAAKPAPVEAAEPAPQIDPLDAEEPPRVAPRAAGHAARSTTEPPLVDPNDPDQLPFAEDAESPPPPAPRTARPALRPARTLPPKSRPAPSEYDEAPSSGSDSTVLEYQ